MVIEGMEGLMPEGLSPPQRIALALCVSEALGTEGFVDAWSRLRGYHRPLTPLDAAIDAKTGFTRAMAVQFVADVKDLVLDRLPTGAAS